jgi:RNA-directed DNA polymerase
VVGVHMANPGWSQQPPSNHIGLGHSTPFETASKGFKQREAKLISRLSCKDGVLPQGAPTSPVITNSLLLRFDEQMAAFAAQRDIDYSRYADDITFSGRNRSAIKEAITTAKHVLTEEYGLKLNHAKTRIASSYGQQRVTGVVVNTSAMPPRELRRRVRAMFYNAGQASSISQKKIEQLRGYIAFLKMFPALADSSVVGSCEHQLQALSAKAKASATGPIIPT